MLGLFLFPAKQQVRLTTIPMNVCTSNFSLIAHIVSLLEFFICCPISPDYTLQGGAGFDKQSLVGWIVYYYSIFYLITIVEVLSKKNVLEIACYEAP